MANAKDKNLRFIRKNGRIIPVRVGQKQRNQELAIGAGMAASGIAIAIGGSKKVFKKLPKFKTLGMLSTIFAGEALLAEGIDKSIESRHFDNRTEQNLKNLSGGTVGVIGAIAGMGLISRKLFRNPFRKVIR